MGLTIDGTSVTEITIDGTPVQEVTIDGVSVWAAGRTITVHENSGSNLTNYVVSIEFPSTDELHTKSNGNDIRFKDPNGNYLQYWIERWNPTRIWVRVPSIPANGTVDLLMQYGDGNTTNAYNNAANTFDWFIDLNSTSQFDASSGNVRTINTGTSFDAGGADGWILTTFHEDVGSGFAEWSYHATLKWGLADNSAGSETDLAGFGWDYGGSHDPGGPTYGTDDNWVFEPDNPGDPTNNKRIKGHVIYRGGGDWKWLMEEEENNLNRTHFASYSRTNNGQGSLGHAFIDLNHYNYTNNYSGSFGTGLYCESNPPSNNSVKMVVYNMWVRPWVSNEPTATI